MLFSNLELSQRLECAEGHACAQFADSRRRAFAGSDSEWIECAGTVAVYDGASSPSTQTFGLGLFEEATPEALDTIESFFHDRGAPVCHEVSPFAGIATLHLLCARRYRPIEISSVLCRTIEPPPLCGNDTAVRVRLAGPDESHLWSDVSAKGWAHDHPEWLDFIRQTGALSASREGSVSFLAELNGQPGAAGALCIHDGVALFAGSSTVPELRGRGLQSALLQERMHYAHGHGCDLAMMVAEAGSNSQRNAERAGFQVAYTRIKWRLEGNPI